MSYYIDIGQAVNPDPKKGTKMKTMTSISGNSIKIPTAINETHNGRKSASIGQTSAPTYYWTAKRGDKKALKADGQLRAADLARYVGLAFSGSCVGVVCTLENGRYYTMSAPASLVQSLST